MAVIAADTHPDVFATVTSVAGGEYALDQMSLPDGELRSPDHSAWLAWAQMGEQARQVPMQIIQGTKDTVVPPMLATRLAQSWSSLDDLIDDGQINGSVDLTKAAEAIPAVDGKHGFTRTTDTNADGETLIESYLVSGQAHAWPGAHGQGLFTDKDGPEGAQLVWDFARDHPMP